MLAKCLSIGVLAALPLFTSIVLVTEPASLADLGLCVMSWAATALFADRVFA
jgi:hypothetical protein